MGWCLSACKHNKRTAYDEQDTSNSNPNPNPTQCPRPNQWHIETKVPALQAEHVEDDVASVIEEYVPAKASDKAYG